eukprot:GEMP01012520.1.p1 GENE.GEMP01012520.1~~GEMP01012520.1.p1  ORF type:complete len:367 (-),score=70.43 GEMP01012520.1:1569-2669(-)
MGSSVSANLDVTDRKSVLKNELLKREDWYQHQHAMEKGLIVRAGPNSGVFLASECLPRIAQFLFGTSLIRCFEVCPLWFVLFFKTLDELFAPIEAGFKQLFEPALSLEYARTDWSPVHVNEAGIRIDRILIARVTNVHAGKSLRMAYDYQYVPNKFSTIQSFEKNRTFQFAFQFDVFGRSSARSFWIHKDICRFHGDETRVAATQNVTPVRVDDRIEIAVNLFNALGFVDVKSVRWHPLIMNPAPPMRHCPVERELFDWYDLDAFQSQSVERLQIPDFFGPQLVHERTEYAGIDIAVSRTRFRASTPGVVPQADRILGSRFEVLPRHSPIILPLKRVGMQHDRFTKIQLREGDVINLYISQGGKMT